MGIGGRGPRRLLWLMLREWRVCGATPLRRQPKKLHAKQTDWLKACNNTTFMSTIAMSVDSHAASEARSAQRQDALVWVDCEVLLTCCSAPLPSELTSCPR